MYSFLNYSENFDENLTRLLSMDGSKTDFNTYKDDVQQKRYRESYDEEDKHCLLPDFYQIAVGNLGANEQGNR